MLTIKYKNVYYKAVSLKMIIYKEELFISHPQTEP